jgi:hypothetical protein
MIGSRSCSAVTTPSFVARAVRNSGAFATGRSTNKLTDSARIGRPHPTMYMRLPAFSHDVPAFVWCCSKFGTLRHFQVIHMVGSQHHRKQIPDGSIGDCEEIRIPTSRREAVRIAAATGCRSAAIGSTSRPTAIHGGESRTGHSRGRSALQTFNDLEVLTLTGPLAMARAKK